MRMNLPATQREFQYPGHEALLSATDLDRHISSANAAFIRPSLRTGAQRMVAAVQLFAP